MDEMIEDAVLAAGGEMDDMPGEEEEFMPVRSLPDLLISASCLRKHPTMWEKSVQWHCLSSCRQHRPNVGGRLKMHSST
jgi:hypothetical protein